MLFDFEKFSKIAASVFPDGPYSLEDALGVFRCYFEQYEAHTGHPHPPIKASQIVRIIRKMPYWDEEDMGGNCCEIEPYQYPPIIEQYFETAFKGCDRNINHFFSGRIRELRYYESCY